MSARSELRSSAIAEGRYSKTLRVSLAARSSLRKPLPRWSSVNSSNLADGPEKSLLLGTHAAIVDAGGRPESILDRVKQLRAELERTVSDYDRHKLTKRLERLSTKAVVIAVGAINETELKEKTLDTENALQAARSATEEGIVPGGGVALLRASNVLDSLELGGDEQIGVDF